MQRRWGKRAVLAVLAGAGVVCVGCMARVVPRHDPAPRQQSSQSSAQQQSWQGGRELRERSDAAERRAQTCMDAKKHQEAIAALTEVIDLGAGRVKIFFDRGKCYNEAGNYEAALADFAKCLDLASEDVWRKLVFGEQAEAFSGLGRHGEAAEAVTKRLRIESAAWWYQKRAEYNELARNYEAVIVDCNRAAQLEPDLEASCGLVSRRARAKAFLGRYAEAIDDCNRIITPTRKPSDLRTYNLRGWCYLSLGRNVKAAEDGEAYLEASKWDKAGRLAAVITAVTAYRRAGNEVGADGLLREARLRFDKSDWTYPLLQFLAGELDENALIAGMDKPNRQVLARALVGLDKQTRGDTKAARYHLEWAKAHGTLADMGTLYAIGQLQRMDGLALATRALRIKGFSAKPQTTKPGGQVSFTLVYAAPATRVAVEEQWMLYLGEKALLPRAQVQRVELTPKSATHSFPLPVPATAEAGTYTLELTSRVVGTGAADAQPLTVKARFTVR